MPAILNGTRAPSTAPAPEMDLAPDSQPSPSAKGSGRWSHLKIRGRLMCILAMMVIACFVISLVSWLAMQAVSQSAEAIYQRGLLPVNGSLMIRGDLVECQALLNSLIREPAEKKQKELGQQLQGQTQSVSQQLAALGAMSLLPGEQANLSALKNDWQQYQQIRDQKVVPFVFDGDADSANTVFRGPLNAVYQELGQKILALVKDFRSTAQATADAAAQRAQTARRTLVTISVAIVIFGALLIQLIAHSISVPIRNVSRILSEGASQTVSTASLFTNTSDSLAQGASAQAANLEEISASLEELHSMTKQNSDHAREANNLAKQAHTAAEQGAANIDEMCRAMTAIQDSGNDIAKIIKTIDEIAFQTNILALNAAVEAARAGEAGMGFAVVADEVRSLAQRSAQAAKESAGRIEVAITRSRQGGEISQRVAGAFKDILAKSEAVDRLDTEMDNASSRQEQGLSQINTAISQLDQVTQDNAAAAEESAGASRELRGQALQLEQHVQQLLQLV